MTRNYRQPAQRRGEDRTALVTARQMSALDKMADANGFKSGGALLCDVASCTLTELGQKPRSVVQMFVDQAFARYALRCAACSTPVRYNGRRELVHVNYMTVANDHAATLGQAP